MTYLGTHNIEFDEQGQRKNIPGKFNEIEKIDFREMIESKSFKNNFTSLSGPKF